MRGGEEELTDFASPSGAWRKSYSYADDVCLTSQNDSLFVPSSSQSSECHVRPSPRP